MNGSFVRMSKQVLLGGLLTALIAALTLTPSGVAQAAAGTFEWCPAPAVHDDAACVTGVSFQDAVSKAQAAHVPGTIYVNAGTFTGNVTATGLQDVRFIGNANGTTGTTINGSISIFNSKNIIVANFTVTGGISVDGGSGAYMIVANIGTLTVKNSKFDHNTAGIGLMVSNAGDTSLMNVSASNNHDGGISVGSNGNILLTDVTASKNGSFGCDAFGNGTITINTVISKANRFDRNGLYGMRISSPGVIVVTDVSASKNGQAGLEISSGGTITVNTVKSKANRFDSNGLYGLRVSAPGAVMLTDVSASKNGRNGVDVGSSSAVKIDTSKSKMNKFDKNAQNGVNISTAGSAVILDGSASKNGGDGVHLSANAIGIGVKQSKLLHFDRNAGYGVFASGPAVIVLTDSTASRNGSDGANLNSGGGIAVYTVKSKSMHFERNGGYGVYASSPALVGLQDVIANRNNLDGAFLSSGTNVLVITRNSKLNHFDKNLRHGLYASTSGGITLNDVSASKNLLDGAHLSNGAALNVSTVHAKMNKFDGNTRHGLSSSAGGPVTIIKSSASKNQAIGLFLNTGSDAASVTCSAVKNNLSYDIQASLGSANLLLSSVKLTHPGLVDVNFTGSGIIIVNTDPCS